VGLAVIGVLAAMVGVIRSSATPSRPRVGGPLTKTAVIHVSPVDGQGRLHPGLKVTGTVEGAACWIGSVKVSGPAASCSAGHSIYDPCWAEADGPSGRSVVCLIWPWDNTVERLLTKTEIVTDPPVPDMPPWAVELADGQRCRVHTGAHSSLNPSGDDEADVVDYYCDNKRVRLSLLRGIDTSTPVWTARAARYVSDHYERVPPQRIATAWF
jgi:hypothetical protein